MNIYDLLVKAKFNPVFKETTKTYTNIIMTYRQETKTNK